MGVSNKDYSILGSVLGSPYFGKLPYEAHMRRKAGSRFETRSQRPRSPELNLVLIGSHTGVGGLLQCSLWD